MPGKAGTEPIPNFGLHEPVLPPPVIREGPGVELPRDIERPFGGKADFNA